MFAHRYFPARFYAPRYFPFPAGITLVTPAPFATVGGTLGLALAYYTVIYLGLNVPQQISLHLTHDTQEELSITPDTVEALTMTPDQPEALFLELTNTIELVMEG